MKRILFAVAGVCVGVVALLLFLHRVTAYPPSVRVERYQ